MDKKQQTVATYNQSAQAMVAKFDKIGARVEIGMMFTLVPKENPTVLEVGCCNGRDALEIVKHTSNYLGIDISEELIKLARKKVPEAHFEVADIEEYQLPQGIDIIFSFASFIHTPKEVLGEVFARMFRALNPDGVIYLSMKHAPQYIEKTVTDEFGTRTYHLYSNDEILDMVPQFEVIKNERIELRGQTWIEMILKKPA